MNGQTAKRGLTLMDHLLVRIVTLVLVGGAIGSAAFIGDEQELAPFLGAAALIEVGLTFLRLIGNSSAPSQRQSAPQQAPQQGTPADAQGNAGEVSDANVPPDGWVTDIGLALLSGSAFGLASFLYAALLAIIPTLRSAILHRGTPTLEFITIGAEVVAVGFLVGITGGIYGGLIWTARTLNDHFVRRTLSNHRKRFGTIAFIFIVGWFAHTLLRQGVGFVNAINVVLAVIAVLLGAAGAGYLGYLCAYPLGGLMRRWLFAFAAAWKPLNEMRAPIAGYVLGYFLIILKNVASSGKLVSLDDRSPWNILYFSMMNIAPLAYSDIRPTEPVTRTIAFLEFVAGVGWTVIVFAAVLDARKPSGQGEMSSHAVAGTANAANVNSETALVAAPTPNSTLNSQHTSEHSGIGDATQVTLSMEDGNVRGRRRCDCGTALPTFLFGTVPGFAGDRSTEIGAYDISWRRPLLHRRDHDWWLHGIALPESLACATRGGILVVSPENGREEHRLAYRLATLLAREEGWDTGWSSTPEGVRAHNELTASTSHMVLSIEGGRAVGFVIARHRRGTFDIAAAYQSGRDPAAVPYYHCIDRAFVRVRHRGKVLATTLACAVANGAGIALWDLMWEAPLTGGGERLARTVAGPDRPPPGDRVTPVTSMADAKEGEKGVTRATDRVAAPSWRPPMMSFRDQPNRPTPRTRHGLEATRFGRRRCRALLRGLQLFEA